MEDGIGEKLDMFFHNFVAVVGCISLAFYNGWKLASVCFVPFLLILIILYAVAKVITNNKHNNTLLCKSRRALVLNH